MLPRKVLGNPQLRSMRILGYIGIKQKSHRPLKSDLFGNDCLEKLNYIWKVGKTLLFLTSILCYEVILKIYTAWYLILVWYHRAYLGIWQGKIPVLRS